ncbi:uncharacterized protein [Physcomitrium patens]|uniref:Uncharacterized protein n=1 Tax=Physcomitrium patens TaxID=3218 RepID=A0A7I4EFH0_PHYPA|nr:uncharacterized protein LOC112286120 isoform X1 [Physcomitrium patens]|eukprot:XP_024383503.1 uncharacterized protein LOC112286120 isoform X1 [Physcomitrella patens]
MAEEIEKHDGWGIFDRLKNLPLVTSIGEDLVRTPVKTSLQTEANEEGPGLQAIPQPQVPPEQKGDPLMNNIICTLNESGNEREEPETAKGDRSLSNRELLNQLHAVALGIRDFEVLGAQPPKLTQLVGEVMEKRVRAKSSNSENSTKSKAKESSETNLLSPKKATSKVTSKATSRAILKATSKVRKGIIVNESKASDKLAFSDRYLQKAFGLTTPNAQLLEKLNANIPVKKFTSDTTAKKPFKAKTLTTKQPAPRSMGDLIKPVKKEAPKRELEMDPTERLPTKKKIKIAARSAAKQRIHVLPHEKLVLSEAAVAEVVAAKVQRDAAGIEVKNLLEEIRGMTNYSIDNIPLDVTERWIGVHTQKLSSSFNFCSTIIRHTFSSISPKVDPE